ncbi:MAG TPA: hypothetical protein VIX19_03710 [Terriglobales bacterium]
MKFAKVVFWCAGVWGVLVLTPLWFLFDRIGRQYPPAVTHPDFYYGFLGVALAWQIVFLVIASDPRRFRLVMIPAILEKVTYGAVLVVLHFQGRVNRAQMPFATIDLLFAILFLTAFFKTRVPLRIQAR